MNGQLYELAALAGRYVFAALMVLIVLRAARITLIDARRAAALRRMSPETGVIGELLVTSGGQKARTGMRYPVIREGMIGSSRRADVRIRHASVRRRHAWFQQAEGGLKIRAHAGAPLRDGEGEPLRAALLEDGDVLRIGAVEVMLILNEAPEPARRPARRRSEAPDADDPDALFEPADEQESQFFEVGKPPRAPQARGEDGAPWE